MDETLQQIRGDLVPAETESTRVKQMIIANQEAARQSEAEELRLKQRRTELEQQLADLEPEEAALDREDRDLDRRCASVRSALNEIQKGRATASLGSFRLSDSLDGVEKLESQHANVVDLERKAAQMMKQYHQALEELRTIRRQKIVHQHQSLLAIIEQKDDKLMQRCRSIFIRED
jgi:predicted  nucleic acid-binding Zn-ribbon protein